MTRQQLPPQIKKIDVQSGVRYEVIVDAGTDPLTGKRRQVRRRFKTEKDAKDHLAKVTNAVASHTYVPRKTVTVEELCADWLDSLHYAEETTLNAYRYALAPLREEYGDKAAQQLTRPQLDRLLRDLRDGETKTAEGNRRRPWSSRSLNKSVDAWRSVLAYGVERRDLSHNVAASMKKLKRERREMQTYTPAEIQQLLTAVDNDRLCHVWYLALTGLRRSEIAGLRWTDVQLDCPHPTLTIANTRVETKGKIIDAERTKTRSSRRTLPLDSTLERVLSRALERQNAEREQLGASYVESGYVVRQESGEPYHPGSLNMAWSRVTKRVGIRYIRLHDLRHSCATAMHLRGVPLAVIAKWLGHSDPSITARIYTHSQDDALEAAASTLGDIVTTSCDKSGDKSA